MPSIPLETINCNYIIANGVSFKSIYRDEHLVLPSITGSTTETDDNRRSDSPHGDWAMESEVARSDGSWQQPMLGDGKLRIRARRPSADCFRHLRRLQRHQQAIGCSAPSTDDGQLDRRAADGYRQVGGHLVHRCLLPTEIDDDREDPGHRCAAAAVRGTIADRSSSFPTVQFHLRHSSPDPETSSYEVNPHGNGDRLEAVWHN